MRRTLALSGAILFVAGVLLVPVLHRIDLCRDDHKPASPCRHAPSCCICKMAGTSLVPTALPVYAAGFSEVLSRVTVIQDRPIQLYIPLRLTARAPPTV